MNTPIAEPPDRVRPARWPLVSLCVWFVVVAALFACLWTYESTAGSSGEPSATWPTDISLQQPREGRALLLFAHPRCPCTRASLRELRKVLANGPSFESARILFFCPPDAGADWTDTALVREARSIGGVEVGFDENGRLARTFGVETSGHLLLYDASARLQFSGGITAKRNHEGENAGRDAVLAISQGRSPALKATPIFGCPLHNRSRMCEGNDCEVRP